MSRKRSTKKDLLDDNLNSNGESTKQKTKKEKKRGTLNNDDSVIDGDQEMSLDNVLGQKEAPIPSYVVEIAKSGRAECRKCDSKISRNELRVGVITEGEWGLLTRWQHIGCTIFHKTVTKAETLDGFSELSKDMQDVVVERVAKSASEIDEEFIALNPDDLVRKEWSEPKEPSTDLLMPLLPYQKEGLGWMANQEATSVRGGILADEMGMGKTIQAISLILDNRPDFNNHELMKVWNESDIAHGVKTDSFPHGGTLLVLPTVAIRQWQMEIARFTKFGSLSVVVYHGNDRQNSDVSELTKADIIITSYKVLEIEYRKATAGAKVECRVCGKKFYPEKLRVHRKYFCGESAQRTAAQSKTEKKKQRIETPTKDVDTVDSEDEVDKQKKAIKALKAIKEGKAKAQSKSNAKSSNDEVSDDDILQHGDLSDKLKKPIKRKSTSSKKSALVKANKKSKIESDSEDEIDKQKRLIKEAAALKNANSKANAKTLSKPKPSPKSKKQESESSEDEIDKQKRMIKKLKENKLAALKKKAKSPSKSLSKKKFTLESDEDSDEGSEYENDSESESSEDDSELESEMSVEEVVTKVKKRSRMAPKASEKDLMDADDPAMQEVEEDIRTAMIEEAKKRKKSSASNRSLLHELSWFRVILDEAHLIKDRSTSTAKAVFNLVSLNKWCLTGTPLQNRVGELYSLVRFLRIDPHAYYYCKGSGCSCKSLHYRFTQGMCDDCHHSAMLHFCHFNKHILNPIKRAGYINEGRKAMLKLKEQLLDEVLLRRTKTTRAEDIQLPPRIVKVQYNRLDDKEEDFYEALYTQSQAQFNTYVSSGTVLNNYAHIFDILIKLRQAVDHPYLVIYSSNNQKSLPAPAPVLPNSSKNKKKSKIDEEDIESEETKNLCGICQDMIETGQQSRADCGHLFCRDCILDHINTTSAPRASSRSRGSTSSSTTVPSAVCPVCGDLLSIDLEDSEEVENSLPSAVYSSSIGSENQSTSRNRLPMLSGNKKGIIDKIDLSNFQSSSKMEALMQELHMMNDTKIGCKAIVFSQFVSMLDLLEYRITLGGISCVKLLGSMTLDQRDKAIKLFKEDPEVKVMLISLKAGGVALNLTVANHIYIMDPWWNPAAEMQAIDRTHRLGQRKPIFATRFIIENTIEERILKLQEKKRLVFDGTIGGDAGSMAKLTVDDMRFLFQ